MKMYTRRNYDHVTTKRGSSKEAGDVSAGTVPMAPAGQKDAHAFVVPPGGAVGHKNGGLSPTPCPPPGAFSQESVLLFSKLDRSVWDNRKKKKRF